MKVSIWLRDGSIYEDATVAGSDLKVNGNPLDINSVSKIDSAFLYTQAGAKIYRQQADGTIQITVGGVTGIVTIELVEIADLKRDD
jgi:hypothetical protein